jgi:glycosyltransferase involved in cell wall biosynthesis
VKITFLTHCFPPAQDGASRLFKYLSNHLTSLNVKTQVITSNRFSSDGFIKANSLKISQKEKNITRLDVITYLYRPFKLLSKYSDLFKLLAFGPIFKSFPSFFISEETDWIVAGPFPTTTALYAYLASKLKRSRLALIPCYHFQDQNHINKILKYILHEADLIFALTNREKEEYKKLGIDQNKISILGGIVEEKYFLKSKQKKNNNSVLYLGSKSDHKQIELLIEAMEKLWQTGNKAKLIIAGPETLYSPIIKKRIDQLPKNFKINVICKNEVKEKEKWQLIDDCSVLVNPSKYESFGIIFLEAWARKKPVIAYKSPVSIEIIDDNINGLLFENSQELADKIKAILSNSDLQEKLGEEGYLKAKKYTQEIIGNIFYNELKLKQ